VGGGGDQAAGAVGNGIVRRGVVSCTTGTSGVVFAHSDRVQIDPAGRVHTFCHAVPGRWHVMGVVLAAGGSFQWLRNNLGEPETLAARKKGLDPYEGLTALAAKAPAGCEGLIFLPYLTGERTPHADPFAKGCLVGITPRTTKAEVVRAVLEGATYALRDSLEIIRGMRIPVEEIRLSGGGARSALWRSIQADVFGQDVCAINASEGPAYGVALLAGVGTGVWRTVEEACAATIKVVSRTRFSRARSKVYDAYYPHYAALYRALKAEFAGIAGTVGRLHR
jgi:xylulokinase